MATPRSPEPIAAVGPLLKRWRNARRMSQLDLALTAGVSARHVSFLETGRSRPSRDMLMALAGVLDVPLRDRNALLQAAGFAPAYRETALTDPAMADIRQALELILRQHEPFGAIAMDGAWNIVMANQAYTRFVSALAPGMKLPPPMTFAAQPRVNAMRLLFEQDGLRQHLVNWPQIARELLARLSREAAGSDERAGALLQELLRAPGVPSDWREPELDAPLSLVLPVAVALGDFTARFFTTITTLGAPQDVTLQELRIESFHAADAATADRIRAMAQAG
jgi:transcriptional regulator with XRE-family HTH domain